MHSLLSVHVLPLFGGFVQVPLSHTSSVQSLSSAQSSFVVHVVAVVKSHRLLVVVEFPSEIVTYHSYCVFIARPGQLTQAVPPLATTCAAPICTNGSPASMS